MQTMSPEEIRQFLLTGTRTAKIASIRQDGRPHVAPVWFEMDGDEIIFTTWHTTVKAANLRRDGRVSLCVDDATPPYAFVIVEGQATLSADPQERAYWARKIARRYMGPDLAEAYGKRNDVEGELVVRLKPTKVIAQKDLAG